MSIMEWMLVLAGVTTAVFIVTTLVLFAFAFCVAIVKVFLDEDL